MDWTQVAVVTGPAFVGAASALLSAILTNHFAVKRQAKEMAARELDLRQRIFDSLMPLRIDAYRKLHVELSELKTTRVLASKDVDALTKSFLWVDPELADRIVGTLRRARGDAAYLSSQVFSEDVSLLQREIQVNIGSSALESIIARARRDEQDKGA